MPLSESNPTSRGLDSGHNQRIINDSKKRHFIILCDEEICHLKRVADPDPDLS